MNNKYLVTFAVSVYAALFLFAIWSILPSALTGGPAVASNQTELQSPGCDVGTGIGEGQNLTQSDSIDFVTQFSSDWYMYSPWIGIYNPGVFACSFPNGGSLN